MGNPLQYDMGGIDLVVNKLRVGATSAGATGTELTGSEITVLDSVTAGTVTASKALVVDSNKDLSALRNLTLTNVDAGASGTAGSVDVFPSTASKGKVSLTAADSAGDTTTTLVNASQAGARTYTIPDAGASASFVMTEGTQTVNGAKTFGGAAVFSSTVSATGAITPTGGVAAGGGFSVSPRSISIGSNLPLVSTDGTDSTPVTTETYVSEVFVPCNMTVTGVALFNGSNVTGNVTVGLADSTGAPIAAAKSASTAGSGTDAFQLIPFAAPYAAKGPATYYVQVQYDSGTARYNTHTIGIHGVTKQTSQTYGTFTSFTPPTTFTTALGNMGGLY